MSNSKILNPFFCSARSPPSLTPYFPPSFPLLPWLLHPSPPRTTPTPRPQNTTARPLATLFPGKSHLSMQIQNPRNHIPLTPKNGPTRTSHKKKGRPVTFGTPPRCLIFLYASVSAFKLKPLVFVFVFLPD